MANPKPKNVAPLAEERNVGNKSKNSLDAYSEAYNMVARKDGVFRETFDGHRDLLVDIRTQRNKANWEVSITGDIMKLMPGNDDEKDNNNNSSLLAFSEIVKYKLNDNKEAGKLTISMLISSQTGRVKDFSLSSKDFNPIIDHIIWRGKDPKYDQIQSLNLSKLRLNKVMIQYLSNNLLNSSRYPYLKHLNLSNTGLTDKIKTKKSKKSNTVDDEKADKKPLDHCSILAYGLSLNNSITKLYLSSNKNIGSEGLTTILGAIIKHPKLKELYYNTNKINRNIAQTWSDWLNENPTLPRIWLQRNGITTEHFQIMCKGLQNNTHLQWINVDTNKIGDPGVESLCNVLMNGTSNISVLNLRANMLTELSGKLLANAVQKNWTLNLLDLSVNVKGKFGDNGVISLCEGLKKNESLRGLRISGNELTGKCCQAVSDLFANHTNLGILEMDHNPGLNDEAFKVLCKGLSKNSRLKLLNFGECNPGKKGAIALQAALKNQINNTLKLIEKCKKSLENCDTIKSVINDNKEYNANKANKICIDIFPSDLVKSIIEEFVGYCCLKTIDLHNCYTEYMGPGVSQIADAANYFFKQGYQLNINW